MDCDSVRKALAAGRNLSPEESAHLDECIDCGVYALGLVQGAEETEAELEQLLAATETEVRRDAHGLRAARSWSTPHRLLGALGVALVTCLGTLWLTPRDDLDEYPISRMLLAVTSLTLFILLSVRLALHPLQAAPLPVVRRLGVVAAGVVVTLSLALLPPAHWSLEISRAGAGSDWAPRALACFGFGLGLGAPLFAALRLLDRTSRPSRTGAWLAAAAAGLLGNLALQLHCPLTHSAHLVAGHVTVIIVAIALASLLARPERPTA